MRLFPCILVATIAKTHPHSAYIDEFVHSILHRWNYVMYTNYIESVGSLSTLRKCHTLTFYSPTFHSCFK